MHGSIERDGFLLDYVIEGTGLPLLILGDNPYYQLTFSSKLRKRFQLIFAQHKGFSHAPNNVSRDVYELDALVEDMEAVRIELNIEKWILLGHSGNAYLVLEYAKKYPQHTLGVVMVGIAPDLSAASKIKANEYWESIACDNRKEALALSLQRTPDTALADLAPSDYFIADYIRKTPQIWYDYHFDPMPFFHASYFNTDMFAYVWGKLFAEIDITENSENIKAPIWVALGKYDGLVAPRSSWDSVLKSFPTMQIAVYEKSGHTPQYEEAEKFDSDLIKWVDDHCK